MSFSYERMMQRLGLHTKEIAEAAQEMEGYTNNVYKITTTWGKYIYKEFNCYSEQEDKIFRFIAGSRIVVSNKEYRIERYIENTRASFDLDLKDIALEMRRFHSIKMEGVGDFSSLLDGYLRKVSLCVSKKAAECKNKVDAGKWEIGLENIVDSFSPMKAISARKAINLLVSVRKRLDKVPSSRYFRNRLCHNDLHLGNMLKTKDGVEFIDFDVAAMGNPCVDISNLFCEKMFDVTDCTFKESLGWSAEKKRTFVETYAGKDDNIDRILQEVEEVEVCCHFLWYLWAVYKLAEPVTNGEFKYFDYGVSRLTFMHKLKLINLHEFDLLKEILFNKTKA